MSRKFSVAIVGRPNVGKSALFNRLVGKRIAIVDEAEGVTRDRLYAPCEWLGQEFEVIDTAGIDAHSPALFNAEVLRQTEIAIEEADALVMVVDGRAGPTPLDEEVATLLRHSGKRITLAVNKLDNMVQEAALHDFYSLGFDTMLPVSAIQAHGLSEILDASLVDYRPPSDEEAHGIKLALVGRANTGKSTFINKLLDEERCVVSPIAGTTRDSIDIPLTYGEQEFTLIDTAGIRRKHAEHEVVDKFASIRTDRAIERSDACLLLYDAEEGFSTQDNRILTKIEAEGKSCIIFANKWDLVQETRMEHALRDLRERNPALKYVPIIIGSAKEGRNIDKALAEVSRVHASAQQKISTGQLNRFFENALQTLHPPVMNNKRLRIYYTTQVGTGPLRFLCFINHPRLLAASYRRYLLNSFRDTFKITGTPVTFEFRGKAR
jgi:GTPase